MRGHGNNVQINADKLREAISKSGKTMNYYDRLLGNSNTYISKALVAGSIDGDVLDRLCLALDIDRAQVMNQNLIGAETKPDEGVGKQIAELTGYVRTISETLLAVIAYQKKQDEFAGELAKDMSDALTRLRQINESEQRLIAMLGQFPKGGQK